MTESGRRGAEIMFDHLTKRYGRNLAVDDLCLTIEAGEFITMLGPSGSGKTTTLNLLAGFDAQDAGHVTIDGHAVDRLPAHQRGLGVVFQNYALFPHMTAAENVGFGLRQRRVPKARRDELVASAFRTVRLAGMENRRPSQLSGGQQQRVALARAIAFEPRALLMDEPLGALDRALREEMQLEIRRIHRSVGSTVVFVTHDQEEALALSDRIAVFNHGRLHQVGDAEELYERPRTLFVATFLGESTVFRGRATRPVPGTVEVVSGGATVRAPGDVAEGTAAAVVVRPERMRLRPPGEGVLPGENAVPVTLADSVYLGSSRKVVVNLDGGGTGLVRETPGQWSASRPGDRAQLCWPVEAGVLLSDKDEGVTT